MEGRGTPAPPAPTERLVAKGLYRYVRNPMYLINSDPGLITLFLRFLDAVGVIRDRLVYRVHIHETANVAAAGQFWMSLTAAAPVQFRRPTLKRHNPKTTRRNVGPEYRGCLRIEARRSVDLYRRIEGWSRAAMNGGGPGG